MDETFDMVIGDSFFEYSEEILKSGRQLYRHQLETVQAEADVVVLDAPTGAGKTLAALKRVVDRGTPAVFVYPTNSLVRNQVISIMKLLEEDLERKVNLIDSDPDISKVIAATKKTDIDLFHLTGESLDAMTEKKSLAKGSVLDKLLTGTQIAGRTRILLTNPDTLYLAFIGLYHRSGRIWEQISTFQVLVIDEFHLYSGPTLARLLFMINVHRGSNEKPSAELVFLSATHGDTLDLLDTTYPDMELIKATPLAIMPVKGRKTRHKTKCKVRAIGGILSNDNEAERAADDIISFYDVDHDEDLKVKVLGIFSSVTFAVRVARILRNRISSRGLDPDKVVYQLHGLIPRKARTTLVKMNNAILVGTSAIEVGIDFDVPFLVIEAHDVGSFLQRFGRGGRHRECEVVLSVPRTLADCLNEKAEWSFPEFVDESHRAMIELPSYAGFLSSKQVSNIIYAMALAASRKPRSPYDKWEKFDYDAAVDFFYEILESNSKVTVGGTTLKDTVYEDDPKRVLSRIKNYTIKTMVKHGFLRGTMNSVLVKYPGELIGHGSYIFGESDLFDIFKMRGHLEEASGHWKSIPKRLRKRYSKDDMIFIVNDLGQPSYPTIVLTPEAKVRKWTAVYREPDCHLKYKDSHIAFLGQGLLNKRNLAFHWKSLNWRTDYRIPRLYVEGEPGGLVIGDWSFVAEYLLQKQLAEDNRL